MPLAVKKKQERTIARCGNSTVIYLPKEYFIPGESVNIDLEIDYNGNLKLTLKKCLFNFNCDSLKAELQKDFEITCDETEDGTRSLQVLKGSLSVDCTASTAELEPTYVTVSRLFKAVSSAEAYTALKVFVDKLAQKIPGAYVEPDGDIDAIKIFKDPEKYSLENEAQAVDLLHKKGKRLNYTVILQFNSKRDSLDNILHVLDQLSKSDEALIGLI